MDFKPDTCLRMTGYKTRSTLAISIFVLDSRHLISDPTLNLSFPSPPLPLKSSLSLLLVFASLLQTHLITPERQTTMNALDSPLEALAFSYASLGFFTFVNNLWAWVAVLTAAVSFWRIRAAGCPKPYLLPPPNDQSSNGSETDPLQEAMMSDDSASERPPEAFVPETAPGTSRVVGSGNDDFDGVTKGKFTVYYEHNGECERSEELAAAAVAEAEWEPKGGELGKSEWWECWEKLLRVRTGGKGWYQYQELTELNGNVVRLWDGGYGMFAKGSGYRCSCIVW